VIFPHTVSRRIVLHPATAADQARFAQARLRTGIESFRPGGPAGRSPAGPTRLYNAAFIVSRRAGRSEPETELGFATLHALDEAGHLRCGIYLDPGQTRLGIGSEALHLVINYAFATFNVDRVIAQTTEASFDVFGITPEDRQDEDILTDYLFFRGQLWDLHTIRINRDGWPEYLEQDMGAMLPSPLTWSTAPDKPLETLRGDI
jgi:hypothetical protein